MMLKQNVFKMGILAFIISFTAICNVYAESPEKKSFDKGVKLYQDGKYDEAITELNNALEINPGFVTAYGYRANIFYEKNNLDGAISDYSKIIEVAPDSAESEGPYVNRGFSYYRKNNFKQALTDFNKAVEINPNSVGSFYNRGLLYYSIEKYDQSLADYKKATTLSPGDKEAYEDFVKYVPSKKSSDAANVREQILQLLKNGPPLTVLQKFSEEQRQNISSQADLIIDVSYKEAKMVKGKAVIEATARNLASYSNQQEMAMELPFVITFEVKRVLKGDYKEATFNVLVHSPGVQFGISMGLPGFPPKTTKGKKYRIYTKNVEMGRLLIGQELLEVK